MAKRYEPLPKAFWRVLIWFVVPLGFIAAAGLMRGGI